MFRNRVTTFLCLLALVAVVAWAGNASAAIVAEHAGPTVFDGAFPVILTDGVSVGDEGGVEMDVTLPAGPVTGVQGLWGLNDLPGLNELHLRLEDYYDGVTNLMGDYWSENRREIHQATAHIAYPEDGLQHHVVWTWKTGETRLEVDGAVLTVTLPPSDPPLPMPTWTSTAGEHYLGSNGSGWQMFVGTLANVKVYDTYIPGPPPTAVDVTWTGDVNSTWTPGTGNWKATVGGAAATYGDNVAVIFDDTATGTTTVDISTADVTPSSVVFNNSTKTYTVTGTKGIAGATGVTKQGSGTVTMGSVNTYSGLTTLEGGKLVLQGAAKAMVPVLTGAGAQIKTGSRLVLDYNGESTPAGTVGSLMTTSYNTGGTHFNTGKFQSTQASASLGLGWRDDTVAKQISVALTRYGDASLDGTVNLTDLTLLGQSWNGAGKVWAQGDFNYDGAVNLSDLTLLGQSWNQSVAGFVPAGPTGPSAVPEPGTLALLAAASVGLGLYSVRRRLQLRRHRELLGPE